MKLLGPVFDAMGQLLGPRGLVEIVITLYEDDRINFQVEGLAGPVPAAKTYQLLACVAQEVAKQVQAEQAAMQQLTQPQEAPNQP